MLSVVDDVPLLVDVEPLLPLAEWSEVDLEFDLVIATSSWIRELL